MTGQSPRYHVVFQEVHKSFGNHHVLRGLDLRVPTGKITFIIGRSGEGKSVTIKHIVGILRPDTGSVVIGGQSMQGASRAQWIEVRKRIGILFQDGALFDGVSVAENVAFPLREFGRSKRHLRDEVARLLELVGLPGIEAKFPAELSIGQKKRVGLARALALNPELLLYDEPTTGMDSLVSEHIDNLIADTQKSMPGMTSVVISHDIRSVMCVAEHIIFLHEGKAYLEGPPDVFRQSTDPLMKQFLTGSRDGPLAKPIA